MLCLGVPCARRLISSSSPIIERYQCGEMQLNEFVDNLAPFLVSRRRNLTPFLVSPLSRRRRILAGHLHSQLRIVLHVRTHIPLAFVPFSFLFGRMSIETIGEAHALGWRIHVRCAFGRHDGMRTIRECLGRAKLDLETLVW